MLPNSSLAPNCVVDFRGRDRGVPSQLTAGYRSRTARGGAFLRSLPRKSRRHLPHVRSFHIAVQLALGYARDPRRPTCCGGQPIRTDSWRRVKVYRAGSTTALTRTGGSVRKSQLALVVLGFLLVGFAVSLRCRGPRVSALLPAAEPCGLAFRWIGACGTAVLPHEWIFSGLAAGLRCWTGASGSEHALAGPGDWPGGGTFAWASPLLISASVVALR